MDQATPAGRDFALLIHELRELVTELSEQWTPEVYEIQPDDKSLTRLASLGWAPSRPGGAIVPADRTAVELGPPGLSSADLLLITAQNDLVHDGRVTILGPDLPGLDGARAGWCQAVILAVDPVSGPQRFALENRRFHLNRLPGYMARSVPGRLWVRVDRDLMGRGFTLVDVGRALYAAYRLEDLPVSNCEALLAAGPEALVHPFEAIADKAQALARENLKLELAADGSYTCEDLDCEACDEKPYCDQIRDLIRHRREKRAREGRA